MLTKTIPACWNCWIENNPLHSSHITAAHLFHHDIGIQLIMARTGHRSIDGVMCYKRPCIQQQQRISELLNSGNQRISYLFESLFQLSAIINTYIQIKSPIYMRVIASINQQNPLKTIIFNSSSRIAINIITK